MSRGGASPFCTRARSGGMPWPSYCDHAPNRCSEPRVLQKGAASPPRCCRIPPPPPPASCQRCAGTHTSPAAQQLCQLVGQRHAQVLLGHCSSYVPRAPLQRHVKLGRVGLRMQRGGGWIAGVRAGVNSKSQASARVHSSTPAHTTTQLDGAQRGGRQPGGGTRADCARPARLRKVRVDLQQLAADALLVEDLKVPGQARRRAPRIARGEARRVHYKRARHGAGRRAQADGCEPAGEQAGRQACTCLAARRQLATADAARQAASAHLDCWRSASALLANCTTAYPAWRTP